MLNYIKVESRNNYFKGRLKLIEIYDYTVSIVSNSRIIDLKNGKYRYLTERECFRLMGFDDEDFDKLRVVYLQRKGTTSSILYKQAENTGVVDVLEAIIKEFVKKF